MPATRRNSTPVSKQFIAWLGLAHFMSGSLLAQDRALIQQAKGTRIPVSGVVQDYTGRELVLRVKNNEPPRRYPRTEVIEVTTDYTSHHNQGRKLFAAGKIAEANREFTAALEEEDRPWVRREILAGQVRCALWKGDYPTAASRFMPIVESDPETFHYNLVPLNWANDLPPANVKFEARGWTDPKAPLVSKLIGASWLVTVDENADEAEQILKRLARESDQRIQRLAQMQMWRVKLRQSKQIDPHEISRWQQFAEQLPVELRGGSYFVIGQASKQGQDFERAARAFLWLPLVYDSDRWLAAHACFEAADSLSALGDHNQAGSLYSEVVFRFGDTPWGRPAETAWKALKPATREAPSPVPNPPAP
ncbi:tetratricopeptide repeat protein [Schlesneria paludicola]|uniref:tetratricopeptide repeat protein n=1 Tax=Schlesneria paludicola TaxID=360056 RepID=UPI000299FF45|nr:hypothetical protein [Schlesneria paludicola]